MRVYSGQDVNSLYRKSLSDCLSLGKLATSRVGGGLDLGPVCFELTSQKVNIPIVKGRGINPFFAIAEVCWVLGGLNDLGVLQYYLSNYDLFSDDGETLNGAYGFRMKEEFGFNQIDAVVSELVNEPDSRRAVISIFMPNDLKNSGSKDIPCNISILFKIRNRLLDMTVMNRSNDVYWGLPYNLFVFQSLHYYIASRLEVEMGMQRHISDSLHLYERDIRDVEGLLDSSASETKVDNFIDLSLFEAIIPNILAINSRKFEEITCNSLRNLFLSYDLFKKDKDPSSLFSTKYSDSINFLVRDWLQVQYRIDESFCV